MAITYTVNDLIESIKVRAAIPIAQNVFEESDLLRFANEEMRLKVVPSILKVKEEFYVATYEYTIQQGVNRYKIPYRAIGGKLRDIYAVNTNEAITHLTRIQPEQLVAFAPNLMTNCAFAFYVENDDIVLVPSVNSLVGQTLKMKYYLKPNDLVPSNQVGVITAINTGTNTVTLATYPTDVTINVGTRMDFISAIPIFKTLEYDVQVTGFNAAQKTITLSELPDGLQVGDTISLAGESMIPQIPVELQPYLAQAVACRCLESLGAIQELAAANTKLADMEQALLAVIADRAEGNPSKVLNLSSFLRQSSLAFRRRNGFY